MQKESKYRLRQRLKIKKEEEKMSPSHLNEQLAYAIDSHYFWEDIISLVDKGADPHIKTDSGFTIWAGLERIFMAWAEDVASNWNGGRGQWDTEEEKRNLSYINKEIKKIMNRFPNMDIDGACFDGTFLNVVSREARRVDDLSVFNEVFETLLSYGANPYDKSSFRQPIEWFKYTEMPADFPLYLIKVKEQKEELNQTIVSENSSKNKARI